MGRVADALNLEPPAAGQKGSTAQRRSPEAVAQTPGASIANGGAHPLCGGDNLLHVCQCVAREVFRDLADQYRGQLGVVWRAYSPEGSWRRDDQQGGDPTREGLVVEERDYAGLEAIFLVLAAIWVGGTPMAAGGRSLVIGVDRIVCLGL